MDDPRPGLFASLRRLLDSALQLAQVRLALLGNELEEQKLRLTQGLLLSGIGVVFLALASVMLCGFVVVLFWDHRLVALGVLTALFGAVGAALVVQGSRRVRSAGEMFQASLQELARDRAGLFPGEEP
ncbi:phage holin family protein [Ramlibacter humi]|uniref:Phage holin family protein n=1 Tax=Ramlibacter humi TaxID=2530451 RepID=A0A4Z0BGU1_9BURK|nr:phage holin family protein [Ramlibacter humi]TFY97599.1 hypothetical protein EZ216_17880 [Ramlibacter humi]